MSGRRSSKEDGKPIGKASGKCWSLKERPRGISSVYSPNNVLVYYNRAGVYAQLGEIEKAAEDYTSAIKLYPDFANAYILSLIHI